MLEASLSMIHAMIVHAMAPWETSTRVPLPLSSQPQHGEKTRHCVRAVPVSQRRRRPTRSRRRRAHGSQGVSIVSQGWLPRAAAALHQLQRVLPELHQLLAGHGVAP